MNDICDYSQSDYLLSFHETPLEKRDDRRDWDRKID